VSWVKENSRCQICGNTVADDIDSCAGKEGVKQVAPTRRVRHFVACREDSARNQGADHRTAKFADVKWLTAFQPSQQGNDHSTHYSRN